MTLTEYMTLGPNIDTWEGREAIAKASASWPGPGFERDLLREAIGMTDNKLTVTSAPAEYFGRHMRGDDWNTQYPDSIDWRLWSEDGSCGGQRFISRR